MICKVFVLCAFIAVAAAVPVYQPAPVLVKQIQYDAPAQYDFNYAVHDEHTGDIKSQQESRKGDNVQGQYTLIDADGYRRIVDYTADEHNGFNAIVRRDPLGYKTAPIVQKAIIAAPITKYISAAPVKYVAAAPVTKLISAPVTKLIAAPKYINNHAQVSFSGPAHNYQY